MMVGVQNRKHESGAVAVEFAIVLPLLLLLLFGIVEFGLVLYNQQVITNASREAVRYGIVYTGDERRSNENITTNVLEGYEDLLVTFGDGGSSLNATYTPATADGRSESGTDFTVNVTCQYTFLVLPDLSGVGLGDTLQLSAGTTMKME